MATFDDVALMALELPQATEGERNGSRTWSVAGKVFAWERSFSKADIRRYGDETPPDGPILAVRVQDLADKEAVLAANPDAFFTIPHLDGFSAILIQLRKAPAEALREALTDGWLACAPPALARDYLKGLNDQALPAAGPPSSRQRPARRGPRAVHERPRPESSGLSRVVRRPSGVVRRPSGVVRRPSGVVRRDRHQPSSVRRSSSMPK